GSRFEAKRFGGHHLSKTLPPNDRSRLLSYILLHLNFPPFLPNILAEDYTEELAVAHIRRLLDIVACTTSFGGSSNSPKSPPRITPKDIPSKESCLTDYEAALPSPEIGDKKVAAGSGGGAQNLRHGPKGLRNLDGSNDGSEKADGSISMCLPPRLGQFYEFFSFSYLTPPLQYIRRSSRPFLVDKTEDDFFQIDVRIVRVCNGKPTTIVASRKGFYPAGKHLLLNHSLVGLLQQISRAFDAAYRALMKAFTDHNKFGNLPYGFRANTWVVPPVVAENPSAFPQLPVEDENWGGNGGGHGRDGKHNLRQWAKEFAILVAMPCKTAEERQIRDRKAFLLHSLFVDVSVFKAVEVINRLIEINQFPVNDPNGLVSHEEVVGDLIIKVTRDVQDASIKLDRKNDGSLVLGVSREDLSRRNLLKGITADESATVHDTSTLGVVVIRHCGYTAIVKVTTEVNWGGIPQDIDIEDQPEGGENALNVNSLRMLLHKSNTPQASNTSTRLQTTNVDHLQYSRTIVRKVMEESLLRLEEEPAKNSRSIRWELGACWVQHLQNQASGKTEPKKTEETKLEPVVKGLGKQGGLLKEIKKKTDVGTSKVEPGKEVDPTNPKELEKQDEDKEQMWKTLLSESAYLRLKESETGLHKKSPEELIDMAHNYYADIALPKLVELADKLPHVQSLCIHEMIVRAYKHILQAVIAAVNFSDLATSIASYVNRALYLLHLTCGPSHPNTAATYINVAMMEEGLGNVHVALRYLHEALKCNQRLLGADHIQANLYTAASYHAIAIALSLMEAYSLSVQHEQTTLQILQAKLGSEDLRTQDAAAWLEYFESKALEQQEAARNGTPKPDASISSKGHLSVSDLLDYIAPDADLKARDAQRKARAKIKGKSGQYTETGAEEFQKDEDLSPNYSAIESPSDKENKSQEAPLEEQVIEKSDTVLFDVTKLNKNIDQVQDEASDGGWQEAVPKGRSVLGRKSSGSKRPSLAKLNTNFINASQSSRYRGKPNSFVSPRTNSSESTASVGSSVPIPHKLTKSGSFSTKPTSNPFSPGSIEKPSDPPKSAPSSPALTDQVAKSPSKSASGSVQVAGKLLSYKEVALAPPGTIVKTATEQLAKGPTLVEVSSQEIQEKVTTELTVGEVATIKDEEDVKAERIGVEKKGEGLDNEIIEADKQESISHQLQEEDAKCSSVENRTAGDDELQVIKEPSDEIEVESSKASIQIEAGISVSPESDCTSGEENSSVSKENANENDLPVDSVDVKPTPTEVEKKDEVEGGKETTKKLSATAPPFNPSTIPVFGSVSGPGFKDHGGILPPPINIPPMLTVNPVRRSPHQSATARVPYGPRLSGGYNRSGNRIPRNKQTSQNSDHSADGTLFNASRIMNPLAAEFVPGHPWVPNGYPVSPNAYLASPNGYPFPPNGILLSPTGYPAPVNGIPVTQNGSPVDASPPGLDVDSETKIETEDETNNDIINSSTDIECENKKEMEPKPDVKSVETEHSHSNVQEKLHDSAPVAASDSVATKEVSQDTVEEKKYNKRWGDSSDNEAEIVEFLICKFFSTPAIISTKTGNVAWMIYTNQYLHGRLPAVMNIHVLWATSIGLIHQDCLKKSGFMTFSIYERHDMFECVWSLELKLLLHYASELPEQQTREKAGGCVLQCRMHRASIVLRVTACAVGIIPENPIVRNNEALKARKRGAERAGARRVTTAATPSTDIEER
uniref:Clu domain-containing protein n=1 Tax=Cucumis melo TaxID=3656 RepID=A0A9I9CY66_CUCME